MKLDLPLSVKINRKTKSPRNISLNLNTYRNLHYQISNQAKKIYKERIKELIKGNKEVLTPPLSFSYILYPKTKRLTDIGNVMSIVQKFTEDALVELGVIEDDNYTIIQEINYNFGYIDKDNPRVELTIKEMKR